MFSSRKGGTELAGVIRHRQYVRRVATFDVVCMNEIEALRLFRRHVAKPVRPSPLFDVAPEEPQRFYFIHTYYVECRDPTDVLAMTNYAGEFCSAFSHENMWGVQFHPEKSHVFGMDLFRRFVEL